MMFALGTLLAIGMFIACALVAEKFGMQWVPVLMLTGGALASLLG